LAHSAEHSAGALLAERRHPLPPPRIGAGTAKLLMSMTDHDVDDEEDEDDDDDGDDN
jgi:hypothetical protein